MPLAYTDEHGNHVKRCTKCLVVKPSSEYFKRSSSRAKDGLNPQCKECATAAKWISIAKNKEHYALMNADYYAKHKARMVARYREGRRAKTPDERWSASLKHKYGISLDDYNRMSAEQEHKCHLCGTPAEMCRGQTLCVDHDHETLVVRRLLCHHCNSALGQAKDDPSLLRKMANYIERFKQ